MTLKRGQESVLEDFLQTHVFAKWQHDLILINDTYNAHRDSIDSGFQLAFDTLCSQAAALQEQGKKGPIQYLYISLLRTSLMEDAAIYLMEAYDTNWLLDPVNCSVKWRADFIFDPLFHRMEVLETKKIEYARKITSMDIDRIKQIEAVKYHLLSIEYMRNRVPALLASSAYQQLDKSPEFALMAGEYRDQSETLYGAEAG